MRKVRIKDLCSFLPKSKIKAAEGLEKGKYTFFTSSDIKTMYLNEYLFDEEVVILGTGGKPSCNYFKGKFAVSTDNFVLRSDKINIRYLYYFLRNNNLSILEHGFHGAGLKHISKDYVNDIEIPVVDECYQLNIINNLDLINKKIDFCKNQLIKYDELVKSQFIEMFDESDFPIRKIEEVCSLKSGTTFDKSLELEFGDILYCKVSDMNLDGNEKFMIRSKTYVSKEVGLKSSIPAHSIIFPKRGGAIGTNKKRLLIKDTCIDLNTMGVTPSNKINPEYLYQYFQNLDLSSLCDGSTIPQLNNKNIGPLSIKVPPIELQNKFADFVQQIDKSKLNKVVSHLM